ncbi:MAG: hypothetical protein AB6733_07225 [Clostridiaceae bacterium]
MTASFDFITDNEFRAGLETDYSEMLVAIENAAYKSAQVMAGSIIEAMLIDALIAGGHVSMENGLRMDLSEAINLAKEKGIISATTADLSSVIKGYRNLIHPGRSIRLKEIPTADSAQVSQALVAMVIREVEGWKRRDYGYTAQQIISKLERDSSAVSIISHIVAEANSSEVERLLLGALPNAYIQASVDDETPPYVLPGFIQCYRTTFKHSPEALKKKVMNKYIKMLKEESDTIILPYEIAFVRGSDLKYLSQQDARLAAEHFVGRMQNGVTTPLVEALEGIGAFLLESDIEGFVDPLVKVVLRSRDSNLKRLAKKRLISEWFTMPAGIDEAMKSRIDDWINLYKPKGKTEEVETLEEIKTEFEDIPF